MSNFWVLSAAIIVTIVTYAPARAANFWKCSDGSYHICLGSSDCVPLCDNGYPVEINGRVVGRPITSLEEEVRQLSARLRELEDGK